MLQRSAVIGYVLTPWPWLGYGLHTLAAGLACKTQRSAQGFYTVSSRLRVTEQILPSLRKPINGGIIRAMPLRAVFPWQKERFLWRPVFLNTSSGSPAATSVRPRNVTTTTSRHSSRPARLGVIISSDGYIVTKTTTSSTVPSASKSLSTTTTPTMPPLSEPTDNRHRLVKIDAIRPPVNPDGRQRKPKVGMGACCRQTLWIHLYRDHRNRIGKGPQYRQRDPRPLRYGIESYIQTDAAEPRQLRRRACKPRRRTCRHQYRYIFSDRQLCRLFIRRPDHDCQESGCDIREYGAVQRAVLGIGISDLTPERAKKDGIYGRDPRMYVVGSTSLVGTRSRT